MHCLLVVYIAILICFQYCCSCNFTEMRKNGNKWQSSLWLPLWVRFAFAEGLYERIWLHCCSYILQDAWRDLGIQNKQGLQFEIDCCFTKLWCVFGFWSEYVRIYLLHGTNKLIYACTLFCSCMNHAQPQAGRTSKDKLTLRVFWNKSWWTL